MLAFKLLFLLCLFNFAESCLKIRYPGPPKCECSSLLLNGGAYEEYDGTGVIPSVGSIITAPPVLVLEDEDCAVSMYCESDLELLVFDTDKTYEFLNYPADGMCDPYTQKWKMGDNEGSLITVNRLYGICWKLLNQQPPVTPAPEKKCNACSMDGIIRDMGVSAILINYEEKENSDGCKAATVTCSVADGWDCPNLNVSALVGPTVYKISQQFSENFASSVLTCSDDGQYTIGDLKPTSVWCDAPICSPKTNEPGCNSCDMAALEDTLPFGVEFQYMEDTPTAEGCLRVYAYCHRTDALICHDTEINAHNPDGMWPIATEKTEAAAATTLTCAADGKFYYDNK
ncbi:hypothetical protein B9Z55_002746 [Caenorhabditis nigoni]|nr:hypothetical protein B9Z55_002746 [Caenorhabditis nigoni]